MSPFDAPNQNGPTQNAPAQNGGPVRADAAQTDAPEAGVAPEKHVTGRPPAEIQSHGDETANITGVHVAPKDIHDKIALRVVKFMRVFADAFFAKRYGHRAVVLETVAAVPGMVGGLLQHLKSIRHIRDDEGWIRELLDEAENERMHLMTFIEIAEPSRFERILIMVAQAIFYNLYFFLYLFAPRTAHRIVGYLEEEAVVSYTQYLEQIDAGAVEDVPAPELAIEYWGLSPDARLRDVVIAVRADEAGHRDRNHELADELVQREAA